MQSAILTFLPSCGRLGGGPGVFSVVEPSSFLSSDEHGYQLLYHQILACWHLLIMDDILFSILALLFEADPRFLHAWHPVALVNAAQTTRSC